MSTASYSTTEDRDFDPSDRWSGDDPSNSPEGSTTQQVKARAGKLLDDAKDSAQSLVNEKKDVAADELHDVAGALRSAAQSRSGDDPLLGLTGSAAEGLDRLANALRNKDVSVMMRDMESFARAQPVAFFGLALATGFLAVRFMKASRS
ncbi:hypothetical protein [Variovorax sp. DT-64]|uniref:hypothetical protein n=1 Tax=Variovorax sp. DT-64 TaxID=3396160 RepID=UPI003F1D6416